MSHDVWESTLACFKDWRVSESTENKSPTSSRHEWDEDEEPMGGSALPNKTVSICGENFRWKEEKPLVELQLEALALMYLEKVRDRKGGWKKYCDELLHHSSIRVPEEGAWMVMMLRSLAWSMSTTRRKSFGSGQAIPSSCWDSQRPVWMI